MSSQTHPGCEKCADLRIYVVMLMVLFEESHFLRCLLCFCSHANLGWDFNFGSFSFLFVYKSKCLRAPESDLCVKFHAFIRAAFVEKTSSPSPHSKKKKKKVDQSGPSELAPARVLRRVRSGSRARRCRVCSFQQLSAVRNPDRHLEMTEGRPSGRACEFLLFLGHPSVGCTSEAPGVASRPVNGPSEREQSGYSLQQNTSGSQTGNKSSYVTEPSLFSCFAFVFLRMNFCALTRVVLRPQE